MKYYEEKTSVVLRALGTSEAGLDRSEAARRLRKFGLNEIVRKKKTSAWQLFLRQFNSFVIWILIAAAAIALLVGEVIDSAVIAVILVINAAFGFMQEYRAERSIEAIKRLASPRALVVRNGAPTTIAARELVPGDIIILKAGDRVPADSRLAEAAGLETQESSLTGESTPVRKTSEALKGEFILADQRNMVFSGTTVNRGRGRAVVVGTGMRSELGRIATFIESAGEELTPVQKRLDTFGKQIGAAVIAITMVIFLVGWWNQRELFEMFLASISLAVAAIPEGLPAVVTISLALGIQRMARRNALIRRLPSVETLGAATVVCTDKTGTLTRDEMTVRQLYTFDRKIKVSGAGYSSFGTFSEKPDKDFLLLLKAGALCNDSTISENKAVGDPTEAALIVSALKAGLRKAELETKSPRIDEIPFESERRLMSTVHKEGAKKIMYTKGAPDVVIGRCTSIMINGKLQKLDERKKKILLKQNEESAGEALRVIGIACKEVKGKPVEDNLTFIGMQAMIDPPRPEAREAIEVCKKAGIKVIMITGDHRLTAVAIAKELGLTGKAITGEELDRIKNLENVVEDISIYARVSPEHKLRIVDALKKKGHMVAMTGDGINDAPALKKADIGIAMGRTGTDVAREASDMVLTDDNFASIVGAVEEGRNIDDNIRKFVEYLLSSNLGEILTIFIGVMLGLPLPLLAIQILWINLVTDGLPALALGVDPPEKDIMLRSPKKKGIDILTKGNVARMGAIGLIMAAGTLGVFIWYLDKGLGYAQTMAFTTLVIFQMFNVFNSKSRDKSIFQSRIFSNRYLIYAILSSLILQFLVVYTFSPYFKTVPLLPIDWLYAAAVASSVMVLVELGKLFYRIAKH